MKEFKISFSEEEVKTLNEEVQHMEQLGIEMETIEEYIAYAAMAYCNTMRVMSSMKEYDDEMEKFLSKHQNVQVGIVNMPVKFNDSDEKEEFSEFLSDVLNQAVKDFNDRNDEGPLN